MKQHLLAASVIVPGALACYSWVVAFFAARVVTNFGARVPYPLSFFFDATTVVTAVLLTPVFVISMRAYLRRRRGEAARGEVLTGMIRVVPWVIAAGLVLGLATGVRAAKAREQREVASASSLCREVLGAAPATDDRCVDVAITCRRMDTRSRVAPPGQTVDGLCVQNALGLLPAGTSSPPTASTHAPVAHAPPAVSGSGPPSPPNAEPMRALDEGNALSGMTPKNKLMPLAKTGAACAACTFNARCALLTLGDAKVPCCDYVSGETASAWKLAESGHAAECLALMSNIKAFPLAKADQECAECSFDARCALSRAPGANAKLPCCDYTHGKTAGEWRDDENAARCLARP